MGGDSVDIHEEVRGVLRREGDDEYVVTVERKRVYLVEAPNPEQAVVQVLVESGLEPIEDEVEASAVLAEDEESEEPEKEEA